MTVVERVVAALVDGAAAVVPSAATDDAGLVEALGVPVVTVPRAEEAFEVTRPLDLLLAGAVLSGSHDD